MSLLGVADRLGLTDMTGPSQVLLVLKIQAKCPLSDCSRRHTRPSNVSLVRTVVSRCLITTILGETLID